MEFIKFLHILAFISLGIVVSHATLPYEEYWNSVLPNSPMPKAIKDMLQHSAAAEWAPENKSTTVGETSEPENKRTNVGVSWEPDNGTGTSGESNAEVTGNITELGKTGATTMIVTGGVTVGSGWINLDPPACRFFYCNRAGENQQQSDPNAALFFIEKDLHPGKIMKLNFSLHGDHPLFLTRHDADSIPFSSEKLPEILSELSVDPSSDEAEVMKKTLQECEEIKSVNGEEKLCATSLESMIDFTTSKLGKDVDAISTNAVETVRYSTNTTDHLKSYRIVRVKQMPPGKPVVACHLQEYAYAVFYCHKMETPSTVGYKVWMAAGDGSQAEAVAVCHRDTAAWNPMHLAFEVLKVKPGGVPVCHFLPMDHVLWVSKPRLG
ncbi:BURP domain-containing protein 3 [Sesamum alatum]|uniref:BURP domain-containing protein 3 n=1 Tax=Sesamum alatum TaxID=300844 RepID=A0AAE2CHJ4_9LAMI|nr:BURP domain-containing protein 3 [Sesamum alatum]